MNPGRKNANAGKAKNANKTFRRLFVYTKKYRAAVLISLFAITVASVLMVMGPKQIEKLTDEIFNIFNPFINAIDMNVIQKIGVTLGILYIVSLVLNLIQNYIMSTVTQKLSHNLRKDISEKINKVPLKYFDQTSTGDTISRVTNDVDTIGQSLNQSLGSFVGAIVMLVVTMFMMFYTSWILALTAIVASLLGFVLIGVIMSKSQKFFIAQQTGLGDINGYVEEIYTNHNVVSTSNAKEITEKEFGEINHNLYSSAWRSQFFSGLMMPLMSFIGNLGYLSVVVVGAILATKETSGVTIGVISAFMIYVRLFMNPLTSIAQATSGFQRAAAAAERVFEFIDETELENEDYKDLEITNTKGNVEFKNVKFGYDEDKTIINNFTAKVKAGQKVAIVGPTGAGKTTMVNLLMRFYEIDEGQILIDGIDTKLVTRENVHDQFCMVLQDTWIFNGTIIDNIIYSEQGISREDVISASKKLGLDHFVRTLADGYDTILDDKTSLSEGQKQLITIARAMIKNAPLLILDEATSSVDTRTEIIIQNAMDELMKGRTSFVIAHRLSTIKNADLILVMREGDIVESGSHDKLLAKDGFYAELYNSQFQEEE